MIATILQATGATAIALGVGLIYPPAGIIVAGILAVLIGISLERK
jgi:hypothetical protein